VETSKYVSENTDRVPIKSVVFPALCSGAVVGVLSGRIVVVLLMTSLAHALRLLED
jgi:hypothetical protein